MLNHALSLLDDINAAVASEPCDIDVSRVTAGEPAAPNPGCVDIAVWISSVTDSNAFLQPCLIKSDLELSYRIGWCYTESVTGPSEQEELDASECLYGLMEAVWCELVSTKSAGTIAGTTKCDQSELGTLSVNPRQGGWVSATGTVTLRFDCVGSAS